MSDFLLSSYDYDLPESCIAQTPIQPADHARLLVYYKEHKTYNDHTFLDLPQLLQAGSVLFFNDTKVMQSRIVVLDKKCVLKTWKESVIVEWEIFVYQIHDDYHFEVLVSDGKHYRPGSVIYWDDTITLYSESFTQEWLLFRIEGADITSFLDVYGYMPLPPYISYDDTKAVFYQTCFAHYIGSAAAPTASLHFTPALLSSLSMCWHVLSYATLHVWLGTFKPVYTDDIRSHDIHKEQARVPIKLFAAIASYIQSRQDIVAVGTTMMRLLESLPYVWCHIRQNPSIISLFDDQTIGVWDTLCDDITVSDYIVPDSLILHDECLFFWTKIFIYPWFRLRLVDHLITNFHLPKSSLLMLVSSCIDREELVRLYRYAIDTGYRFYSFGDGMLLQWLKSKW